MGGTAENDITNRHYNNNQQQDYSTWKQSDTNAKAKPKSALTPQAQELLDKHRQYAKRRHALTINPYNSVLQQPKPSAKTKQQLFQDNYQQESQQYYGLRQKASTLHRNPFDTQKANMPIQAKQQQQLSVTRNPFDTQKSTIHAKPLPTISRNAYDVMKDMQQYHDANKKHSDIKDDYHTASQQQNIAQKNQFHIPDLSAIDINQPIDIDKFFKLVDFNPNGDSVEENALMPLEYLESFVGSVIDNLNPFDQDKEVSVEDWNNFTNEVKNTIKAKYLYATEYAEMTFSSEKGQLLKKANNKNKLFKGMFPDYENFVGSQGNEADAKRHAMIAIELTQSMGAKRAKEFMDAREVHALNKLEQEERPWKRLKTKRATIMDLYNNMRAIELALDPNNEGKTVQEIYKNGLKKGVFMTSLPTLK